MINTIKLINPHRRPDAKLLHGDTSEAHLKAASACFYKALLFLRRTVSLILVRQVVDIPLPPL